MSVALSVLSACPISAAAPAVGFIDSIGGMEMLLVAFVGLLLFGGKGLPEMARTFGKAIREFKKATASVENEVKRVMNEEPEARPRPKPRPAAPRLQSAPPKPTSAEAATPSPAAPETAPAPAAQPGSDASSSQAGADSAGIAARRQTPPPSANNL